MKELDHKEVEMVSGGVIPVLIAIGKGIGWGITQLAQPFLVLVWLLQRLVRNHNHQFYILGSCL